MKSWQRYVSIFGALVFGFLWLDNALAEVRAPVWAGKFYPSDGTALLRTIEQLTRQAYRNIPRRPANGTVRALILPHAGYVYSGLTAAHAVYALDNRKIKKVVLMGPDHRVGFSNGAVSAATAWDTPLGRVRLHADAQKLNRQSDLFRPVPASDDAEHSLEVILPFLQRYCPEFELVPIVLGPCAPQSIANVLDGVLDRHTLLVVSADLSHYLPYDEAVARDESTIDAVLALNSHPLLKDSNRSCGRYPIAVLLHLARKHHWRPVLLNYANSGDTAGDRRKVVGYAAIAFYGEEFMASSTITPAALTASQGKALVALARQTLMQRFDQSMAESQKQQLDNQLKDPALQSSSGTFVTLKIGEHLRGCIGSLVGKESLVEGVRNNAINAAFHDPRFGPLTAKELARVNIEVSVLTEPQPLTYADAHDLVAKLRPHVDGVTISKGLSQATFLPQVWEQLPETEVFLSHLCRKAGLAADVWRQGELDVETYQVQYFEEHY